MNNQIQEDLMSSLGLSNLPQDKQEELLIKMTEVILKRMFVETMDRLNAKDQELFGSMMDAQTNPDEIEKFLQGKIADYDTMLQSIIEKFKEEMISVKV